MTETANPFELFAQKDEKIIDGYFKRDKWAIYEAAAILSGHLYLLEIRPVGEIKDAKIASLIDRLFGMYMEEFTKTDTQFNSYSKEYPARNYETDYYYQGKIPPKEAVQLAVDSGFDISSGTIKYFRKNNLLPEPKECSLIRRFYKKWASMKLWSLDEASMLLFGVDPDEEFVEFRFLEFQPEYMANQIEQLKKYLQKAALSGDIEYVTHDTIFMKPVAALKWAATNNRSIPYLLTEEFEKAAHSMTDNRTVHNAATSIKKKIGAKLQHSWQAYRGQFDELISNFGLPGIDEPELKNQAALEKKLIEWGEQNFGKSPAPSTIRRYVSKWLEEIDHS